MADGRYSDNAQAAAAVTPSCSTGGCPSCEKAGLPLLLVRPGVADKDYANSPARAGLVRTLLQHKLPYPLITASGYVARTLRPGYVIAFYEDPHTPALKANNGWDVFKVSDGGYLTPYPLEGLPEGKENEGFTCKRTSAYAAAMLFVVPEAKKAGKLWLAYSDHLWCPRVRKGYEQNESLREERMVRVNARRATCKQSLPLKEGVVTTVVADYDPKLSPRALRGNPFAALPPGSKPGERGKRPETANGLAAEASRIIELGNAGGRGFDADDALIVCLTDAVGVASETADLRINLCNTAAEWVLEQPEGYQKLQTALTIEGLLKRADEQGDLRKASLTDEKYSGLNGKEVSEKEFEELKSRKELPAEATLAPKYEYNPYDINGDGRYRIYGRGIISFPSARQIDGEVADLKSDILDGVVGGAGKPLHRDFIRRYQEKLKEDAVRLLTLDLDYHGWISSSQRRLVTENDFDEATPTDGIFYLATVARCTNGGPMTDRGVELFEGYLLKDPNDKDAILIRALLGNQKDAIDTFNDAFKPTKIHKEIKNVFKLIEEIDKAVAGGGTLPAGDRAILRALPSITWIAKQLPLLRNFAALYGHLALTVVGATAMGLDKLQKLPDPWRSKIQQLTLSVTNSLAKASGASIRKFSVSLDVAAKYWRMQMGGVRTLAERGAKQISSSNVKSLVLGGAIWIDLKGYPGAAGGVVDIYVAVRDAANKAPGAVDATTAAGAAAGTAVRTAGANAADAVADFARTVGKSGRELVVDSIAVFRQGGATFSAAGAVLQALSFGKTMHSLEDAPQEAKSFARLTLLTSGMGFCAALLEVREAFLKQAGATAAANTVKVVAGSLSAISLMLDATVSFIKYGKESSSGDGDAAAAYFAQGVFFLGAAAAGGFIVAANAGWITGTIAVGYGLSWTGWGLLLIGLGLVAGYVAMLLNDLPTVEWVKKSIWGTASDKWGGLSNEQNELNKILLGMRVEFYSGAVTKLETRTVGMGSPIMTQVPTGVYEAWVRLYIPVELRKLVRCELGFSVYGSVEQKKQWKLNADDKIIDGAGTKVFPVLESDSSIERRLEMNRSALSKVVGYVRVWDSPADGDIIINEVLE